MRVDNTLTDSGASNEFEPSIKRQVECSVLIVTGVVMIALVLNFDFELGWFALLLWLAGGPAVGAGIFHIFKRAPLGAAVGLVIQLALLAMMYVLFSSMSFD
jgi:hypothetical protein